MVLEMLIAFLISLPRQISVSANDVGACFGECAGNWQQCGGDGFDGFSACCEEDFFCYSVNENYSQCRRTNSVKTGWTGPFNCDEGGSCKDPKAVASEWSGYELSNRDLTLDSFLDYVDDCAAECHANSECIAYQENEDGGNFCNLYADGVISVANIGKGNWRPNFDSVLSFVKCYRPPQLCLAATVKQVDGSDPQLYELLDQDVALVFLTEEFAVGDCATICRMYRPSSSPCVGFALRGNKCYPLFANETPGIKFQEVEMTPGTTVYSISDCLA